MKKIVGLALILIVLQLSGTRSQAQPFTPTTCPTNFTCSVTASGTRPLTGTATDGHATSIIGVISFDASSNITGFFAVNSNGTVASFNLTGATCVSGTGGTLGSIDFTPAAGHPLVFDFVTSTASTGTGLLVADGTPNATNGASVLVGKCINSPASS